jgi:radical SAM protein with 4Fe4S-binding SPASM domain
VSGYNFEHLEALARFAQNLNIEDIEFLRFKPAGRGKETYYKYRLNDEQNRQLYPLLRKIFELTGIPIKIDCSFIPMMCYHQPDQEIMGLLSVYGCEAGNALLGVRSNGEFSGCSFLENNESIMTINESWDGSPHLNNCRNWIKHAPHPCVDCEFLEICKGGCHAVAQFETGDFFSPDPECPFVVDYKRVSRSYLVR